MKELNGFSRSAPVLFVEETASTNTLLKELALKGQAPGTVLIARRQSGGRGRLERRFSSPEGGLYLSMLLAPECSAEQSLSITPCTAVAVHRAVSALCGISADIKWPNDLLYNGRKICGILCESVFLNGRQLVILGVGLNVTTPQEAFPQELQDTAGSLLSLCDSANTDKTVAAAQEQLRAIKYIVREFGLDALPEPLKDAALLRITNPEASLADLAQLSMPPVTKSCLSHRFRKIMSYVPEEIMQEQ